MRWELLFADLEALAEAGDRAAFDADVADLGRAERAGLALADRLRAHVGGELTVRLAGGERVRGRLLDVGPDWLLLDDGSGVVVPSSAVVGVEGLSRLAETADGALAGRPGLGVVLRRLSRDRATVRLGLPDGGWLTGTIDRVGLDHLDLAQHDVDEPRRAARVRGVVVVRLAALLQVRSVA